MKILITKVLNYGNTNQTIDMEEISMKKFKMLCMSVIAVFTLGMPATFSNVYASENTELVNAQAMDEIYVTRTVPKTHTSAMWVTETRYGKTYSGYIYNGGLTADGNYSVFAGYIKAGPIVEPYIFENK